MGLISGVGMAILSPLEVLKVCTFRRPPHLLSSVEERAVGIPQQSEEKERIIACEGVPLARRVFVCVEQAAARLGSSWVQRRGAATRTT